MYRQAMNRPKKDSHQSAISGIIINPEFGKICFPSFLGSLFTVT
jgi:hypothetical protein